MACSLSLAPLCQLQSLAGQEHGRPIPLADIGCVLNTRSDAVRLAGMTVEEVQRLFVELGYAFVNGGMRAGLENYEFAPLDGTLHWVGETGRAHDVVAADGGLGRSLDTGELGDSIMGDHRVRLTHEGIERLLWPAAHESGKLIDVIRLCGVKLRCETEWKNPLDYHFLDTQALCARLPAFDNDLEEWVGLLPAAMQRQRFHPLRIFAAEP